MSESTQEYWVENESVFHKDQETSVAEILSPEHIEPIAKILDSHNALLDACKKGKAQLESTIIPMGARMRGTPIFRTIQELRTAIEQAEKAGEL